MLFRSVAYKSRGGIPAVPNMNALYELGHRVSNMLDEHYGYVFCDAYGGDYDEMFAQPGYACTFASCLEHTSPLLYMSFFEGVLWLSWDAETATGIRFGSWDEWLARKDALLLGAV